MFANNFIKFNRMFQVRNLSNDARISYNFKGMMAPAFTAFNDDKYDNNFT